MPPQLVSQSKATSFITIESTSNTQTQSLLTRLRSSIDSLEGLETILLDILFALNAIPHSFSKPPQANITSQDVLPILPTVQHLILTVSLPTWLEPLRESGHLQLAKQLFCPLPHAPFRFAKTHCKIVMAALPIILAHFRVLNSKDPGPTAILKICLSLVEEIASAYPIDVIHRSLFLSASDEGKVSCEDFTSRDWEDYVRAACSVAGKVANALHEHDDISPRESLQHGPYFSGMCVATERLISQSSKYRTSLDPQTHLLLKLLNLGLFPRTPPPLSSQPSFFTSTLSTIRRNVEVAYARYSETWAAIVRSLPPLSQQTFVTSLLGALDCTVGLDTSGAARSKVHDTARMLRGLLETMAEEDEQLWSTITAVVCGSRSSGTWDIGVMRAVVQWIAEPRLPEGINERALDKLLDATLTTWTDTTYIRHSLLAQHRYTTALLLLTLNTLPQAPSRLAFSQPFIASITAYLAHLDESIRRCGMLVAEVVAQRCGKTLTFGGWDGEGEGLEWARSMRAWQCDWGADKSDSETQSEEVKIESPEVGLPPQSLLTTSDGLDSDDSLTGYASSCSRSSSRAPSPTPSEIAEMEKDPTIRRPKPVARPVYLAQLAPMLRADQSNEEGGAERVAVALSAAEVLIRRKKGFGLELEENVVEVAIVLIGIHDSYELSGFDAQRQGALVALVACCPQKAAPTLVEQLFTNQYAIAQRITILTALALGARELAGLPVPGTQHKDTPSFPSKMLPPALHRRFYTGGVVQGLLEDVSKHALTDTNTPTPAPFVRSRQLRVGRLGSSHVAPLATAPQLPARTQTFIDVAAEHFIMPLINHMWRHLRTRASTAGVGAGTGLVLTPVVLSQYLGTLAVLLHAAQHSPAYLVVLAPSTLELVLMLGTQPTENDKAGREDEDEDEDAAVLTAALEAALVVLNACFALDGGRELGLGQTALLLAVGEWVVKVVSALGKGRRVSGGGGVVEGRLAAVATGVLEKVGKVQERWGRAMVGM